jgi:hypothetical protein
MKLDMNPRRRPGGFIAVLVHWSALIAPSGAHPTVKRGRCAAALQTIRA